MSQDDRGELARWLRARRRELLLTQEAVAERAGIAVRTLRALEAGRGNPRPETRRLLAAALGPPEDAAGPAAGRGGAGAGSAAQGPATSRPAGSGTAGVGPAVAGPGTGGVAPAAPGVAGPGGGRAPAQLPLAADGFVGRDAELRWLDQLLGDAERTTVAVVSGTAGVGKTALVLRWAHAVADRFPDGQLFVDLRGYDAERPVPPAAVLDRFLRDLGTDAGDVPPDLDALTARFRTALAGRRMLVVLDNADSAEQVRALLPGTAPALVLVTSRDSLAGLVARDGARRLDLDLLATADAEALLRLLVPDRARADPAATAALAARCARLPLALRVVAEVAAARPGLSLRDLVDELAGETRRLDLLDEGGDPRSAVRVSLSWSYRQLAPEAARAFRLLGLHPGQHVDPAAAAALLGRPARDADRLLTGLTRAHLVARSGAGFTLHDLLRAYAGELAAEVDPPAEREAALARLAEAYLERATACARALAPEERHRGGPDEPAPEPVTAAEALRWLDAEREAIVALSGRLPDDRWVMRMSGVLFRYLFSRGHYRHAEALHGNALRAAVRAGDRTEEGYAARFLANIGLRQGHYLAAVELGERALALLTGPDVLRERGSTLNTLGVLSERLGRYAVAAGRYQEAHELAVRVGDRLGECGSLNNLGTVSERLGRYEEAAACYEGALALRREIGDRAGEGLTLGNLATLSARTGRDDAALPQFERALEIARETGDRNEEAYLLTGLGGLQSRQGRTAVAAGHLELALRIAQETGDRSVSCTALNSLGGLDRAVGDLDRAVDRYSAALALARESGERFQEAGALAGLGGVAAGRDDPGTARHCWQQALAIYAELDVPEAAEIRAHLADV